MSVRILYDGRPLPDWLRWMHAFRLWRLASWLYRRRYGLVCPTPIGRYMKP
jgi:hypothetical protein